MVALKDTKSYILLQRPADGAGEIFAFPIVLVKGNLSGVKNHVLKFIELLYSTWSLLQSFLLEAKLLQQVSKVLLLSRLTRVSLVLHVLSKERSIDSVFDSLTTLKGLKINC